jgi:nucleoside-diphosphate-sugar epimerase
MVYGNFHEERANEMSATEPVNAYGRMKLAAEAIAQNLGARGAVDVVIVRPMAVYGPGDHYDRVVPKFCSQCLAGDPLVVRTGADSLIDFSYVGDIVEGLISAATEPAAAGEIFNLSYGEARTVFDLVSVLQTHFPDLRYDIAPALGPARPNRGALDISKAKRLLGYRPTTALDAGIAHCIRHLRDCEVAKFGTFGELGGS